MCVCMLLLFLRQPVVHTEHHRLLSLRWLLTRDGVLHLGGLSGAFQLKHCAGSIREGEEDRSLKEDSRTGLA